MKKHFLNLIKRTGYKIIPKEWSVFADSTTILKSIFKEEEKLLFFDVGAHEGMKSHLYSEIFPNAEIFSFEPFPESFKILEKKNIKRVKAYNFGFSNKRSTETFFCNVGSATNSLLELSDKASVTWKGNKWLKKTSSINCHFHTIDEFCQENKINLIDFMKIDVQGAEYLVLEGAKSILKNKRIKYVQMEIIIGDTYKNQKPFSYYIKLFEDYGYKLKILCDSTASVHNLIQTDLFFELIF